VAPEETLSEEHDRLQQRTNELRSATEELSLSVKPFDKAVHEILAAELREHHSHLRAHTERQKRENHIRRL
jgi:hypothetical protein